MVRVYLSMGDTESTILSLAHDHVFMEDTLLHLHIKITL